jgi:hypothetical protein
VRWGNEVSARDGEPLYSPPEVLMPLDSHIMALEHVAADGRIVDPAEAADVYYTEVQEIDSAGNIHVVPKITAGKIKKWVDVDM